MLCLLVPEDGCTPDAHAQHLGSRLVRDEAQQLEGLGKVILVGVHIVSADVHLHARKVGSHHGQ